MKYPRSSSDFILVKLKQSLSYSNKLLLEEIDVGFDRQVFILENRCSDHSRFPWRIHVYPYRHVCERNMYYIYIYLLHTYHILAI